MRVDVIPIGELDDALCDCWRAMQRVEPETRNPFFSPEFAIATGAVRNDVFVAVVQDDTGTPQMFFPFQREQGDIGWPVGYPFSDYHGPLASPGFRYDIKQLVKACGLKVFKFYYFPTRLAALEPFFGNVEPSPIVRLQENDHKTNEGRKFRKLERDLGPLRFECRSTSEEALAKVIDWKRAHCRRTGFPDMFRKAWLGELVRMLQVTEHPSFSGILTALYAGDHLVAGHMGIRSDSVWHWWFPSYDLDCARYSPGLLLLIKMIEHGTSEGLDVLDFGTGRESFKQRFANDSIPVARGRIIPSTMRSVAYACRDVPRTVLKGTPLESHARNALDAYRGWRKQRR